MKTSVPFCVKFGKKVYKKKKKINNLAYYSSYIIALGTERKQTLIQGQALLG